MRGAAEQSEVDGWVIESRRSRYSISYWFLFVVFGFLGQSVPTPPDITYTVRNKSTGQRRVIELPGDHTAADLSAVLAHEPAAKPAISESPRSA
jgi:hypothetical protein